MAVYNYIVTDYTKPLDPVVAAEGSAEIDLMQDRARVTLSADLELVAGHVYEIDWTTP